MTLTPIQIYLSSWRNFESLGVLPFFFKISMNRKNPKKMSKIIVQGNKGIDQIWSKLIKNMITFYEIYSTNWPDIIWCCLNKIGDEIWYISTETWYKVIKFNEVGYNLVKFDPKCWIISFYFISLNLIQFYLPGYRT